MTSWCASSSCYQTRRTRCAQARSLWTRLSSLRFASTSTPVFSGAEGAERYASFVSSAIAVRAAQTDPALEHLAISFVTQDEVLPSSVVKAAAERWIRGDAMRHGLKSLTPELHHADAVIRYPYDDKANVWGQYEVMILDDLLVGSAKMETMRLALGGVTVRLPATTGAFASLTDLTLERMEFVECGEHLRLTRLLSSVCCPRLQKLRLRNVSFARSTRLQDMELLIEAEELLELSLEQLVCLPPEILRLRTPLLRVLRMVSFGFPELAISAPRLEELLFLSWSQPGRNIDIGGLPCVRRLRVKLTSHIWDYGTGGHDHYRKGNSVAFRLLRCCTAAACLDLDLHVFRKEGPCVNLTEGRIPRLPRVTSLTVHAHLYDLHLFGISIADILAQCSNLKYLRLCCTFEMVNADLNSPFFCGHPDSWQSHEVCCLPDLMEIELMGLAGTECELRFMQSMLTSTTQLHKVTISFDPKSSLKNRIFAFERMLPLKDHGMWTCCHESYLSLEWNPSLRV